MGGGRVKEILWFLKVGEVVREGGGITGHVRGKVGESGKREEMNYVKRTLLNNWDQ